MVSLLCVALCPGILVSNTGYWIAYCLLAGLVINTGTIIPLLFYTVPIAMIKRMQWKEIPLSSTGDPMDGRITDCSEAERLLRTGPCTGC